MSTHITIGDESWAVADSDLVRTVADIEQAMTNGTVARLSLLTDNRPVTVFFNGKLSPTVVVDENGAPRPTEISGK